MLAMVRERIGGAVSGDAVGDHVCLCVHAPVALASICVALSFIVRLLSSVGYWENNKKSPTHDRRGR
jgi:hypothetical protein